MSAVPGYPNLRYVGGAAAKPAEQHVAADTLARLQRVAAQLGKVVEIFSGSGGPAVRGGGFVGDPHDRGVAVDANIDGRPIGDYPGAVAALHAAGLRAGATDFQYQGRTDPAHVDTLPFAGKVSTPASSVNTLDGFFTLVLRDLGAPVNNATLGFLKGWSQVEGTAAKNNPLATTLRSDGSVDLPGNSAHVQQYPTPEAGAAATAQTLRGYRWVVAALKTGSPVVGGITSGLVSDFNKWSGGGGAAYASKVFLAAQGNPKGSDASIGLWSKPDLSGAAKHIPGVVQAEAVASFLGKLTDPSYILRGLQVVAGGGMVAIGVVLLARQVALAADLPDPAGLATKTASAAPAAAIE